MRPCRNLIRPIVGGASGAALTPLVWESNNTEYTLNTISHKTGTWYTYYQRDPDDTEIPIGDRKWEFGKTIYGSGASFYFRYYLRGYNGTAYYNVQLIATDDAKNELGTIWSSTYNASMVYAEPDDPTLTTTQSTASTSTPYDGPMHYLLLKIDFDVETTGYVTKQLSTFSAGVDSLYVE